MFPEHDFVVGDTVRLAGVEEHSIASRFFDDGDITVVVSVEPYMGIIPVVYVKIVDLKRIREDGDVPYLVTGIPFAFKDLAMVTKIEEGAL